MDVSITMTKAELKAAWNALSSLGDNEHDQGADDGTLANALTDAITAFGEFYQKREHDRPERITVPMIYLAIAAEAVEIYCTDPADEESEDAPAERAFALRLRELPTMEI
jgi:hypothetical protein